MNTLPLFQGVATAIVTPFRNGGVDYEAFGRLIERQIVSGVSALVVCGTTGEPATMTEEERLSVIGFAVERVAHRVPVIAGTGSNCTAAAAAFSRKVAELGVEAQLAVTPYYNKCTQKGLIAHYEAIHAATALPIIAYNVPSRTGVNMLPATVRALRDSGAIVAVKEASGDIRQISELCTLTTERFCVYSGDDPLVYSVLTLGGKGVISVAANVVPDGFARLCEAYFTGRPDESLALQRKYQALVAALFSEVNPIPVKYALARLGQIENELRLPLTPIEPADAEKVDRALAGLGLL
ncbi:MAG: 4-hydroxy-tetrahydrodipicolinate synthase [Eubacteriales bacterium]|nr:4-hydroxy-tetrahydrodipicolinate synthase [Eubacteriales bacterium]